MIIRQAYGLLDYFGDIGGLIDGLYYLISMLVSPFWKFSVSSHMLSKLFRAGPKQKTPMTQSSQLSLLQRDFKKLLSIPKMRFIRYFFCRRAKDRKKYHSKLRQAKKQLKRELDLNLFIKRQRMFTTAILGLLSRNQVFYVSKMA